MKNETQLAKGIMRRVYAIYYFRKAMRPQARLTAFLVILLLVASSVSMPNVIQNAMHASNFAVYLFSALATTKLYVQLGIIAAALIILSMLIDAFRTKEGTYALS
ncbi:MAG: hypothetical protein JO026_03665 [Patescibacteria group bacterium]|nr:hypothetical protein [Patescibacteria group bacterium]